MNNIKNTDASYNLCNLSTVGTNQITRRNNVIIFTIYSAKVSNYQSFYTPITIATGMPWSASYGFSTLHSPSSMTPVGYCKMNGDQCQINLKQNTEFMLCHVYTI